MLIQVIDPNTTRPYNDTIDLYVKDRTVNAICGCTGKNVYEDYLEFCKDNNIQNDLSSNQFRKRLCLSYKLTSIIKTINGQSVRIIIKK